MKSWYATKTFQRHIVARVVACMQAVSLLKPGGVLVYSTCTITVEENEAIVAWAVNTFRRQLQLVDQVITMMNFLMMMIMMMLS